MDRDNMRTRCLRLVHLLEYYKRLFDVSQKYRCFDKLDNKMWLKTYLCYVSRSNRDHPSYDPSEHGDVFAWMHDYEEINKEIQNLNTKYEPLRLSQSVASPLWEYCRYINDDLREGLWYEKQ